MSSSRCHSSWIAQQGSSGTYPTHPEDGLRRFQEMVEIDAMRTGAMRTGARKQKKSNRLFDTAALIADTTNLETLSDSTSSFTGCVLTPENVANRIHLNEIRYHVWVAAKFVVEEIRARLDDEAGLVRATVEEFLVQLGKAVLGCVPELVTFIDPRLHDNTPAMISAARTLVLRHAVEGLNIARIVVTLPATEQGIAAARELWKRYSICTNLTLVSGLLHAAACMEADPKVLTMPVGPILEWFEKKNGGAFPIAPAHPGIEAIQSCASYIRYNDLKPKLMTSDIRSIPRHTLTTWYPKPTDSSASALRAKQARCPTNFLRSRKGFMAALSAESRSVVSAVLFMGIGKMKVHMERIEDVVRTEVRKRVELETTDLRSLYSRSTEIITPEPSPKKNRTPPGPPGSKSGAPLKRTLCKEDESRKTQPLIEGVDYF
ncbi:hypothetical protein BJ138DRAFT_71132 [Hygrophoropsis aurantiaca]|uniref:Uncharacterized protein n=1 Tax=Hygrophoropsis aurantiaca TaxID=72124 RepID=A0ACB8AD53_9AGAM|nr:hypothetical protein BJ138DRAFT_71132 [Hygrophoropsis aurantiaca]